MANDTILTDDYVAELIASDAKDCSLKYSAMGLDAFKSDKKPANKLKPNTRFLRHIIKETNNHNRALLAKEAMESQARLQEHTQAEEAKKHRHRPEPNEVRRRQLTGITAILAGDKKRSRKNDSDRDERPRSSRDEHLRLSPPGKSKSIRQDKDESRKSSRRGSDKDRRRSRSPRRRDKEHRQRSPRRRYEGLSRRSDRSPPRSSRPSREQRTKHKSRDSEEDSDPLEDLIGPAPPPPQARGRGTTTMSTSNTTSRLSEGYDPMSDAVPEPDASKNGDWDDAVEAFRDRQKWKQQGADRLRTAGFSEEQIRKWERSGGEQDPNDVQWTKKGEQREWDRGKDVAG